MTVYTVLIAMQVKDVGASADDVRRGVLARLGEFYPAGDTYPLVPSDVRAVVATPEVAKHLFDAAEVGLGNEDFIGDAALTLVDALGHGKEVRELVTHEEPEDGAPCCPDPGCGGNPCTFPGYADNH